MCIIIWAPSGQIPHEQIVNAMFAHPHGWGFAVQHRTGLRVFRSTDIKKFCDGWHNRKPGPVLFHARYATHGAVETENCHPFKVRGHNLVAAHNGILVGYGSKKRSDTRHFIEDQIEPLPRGFASDWRLVDYLNSLMGRSKMVLLGTAGSPLILNEEAGLWLGGRWYSNDSALQ